MNIAVLKEGLVINSVVFDDVEKAEEFLNLGIWPEADAVMELPEGFGIGDSYINDEWINQEQPEPEPGEFEPSTDYFGFLDGFIDSVK